MADLPPALAMAHDPYGIGPALAAGLPELRQIAAPWLAEHPPRPWGGKGADSFDFGVFAATELFLDLRRANGAAGNSAIIASLARAAGELRKAEICITNATKDWAARPEFSPDLWRRTERFGFVLPEDDRIARLQSEIADAIAHLERHSRTPADQFSTEGLKQIRYAAGEPIAYLADVLEFPLDPLPAVNHATARERAHWFLHLASRLTEAWSGLDFPMLGLPDASVHASVQTIRARLLDLAGKKS